MPNPITGLKRGASDVRVRLSEVLARGLIRASEGLPTRPNQPTALLPALDEAGALYVTSGTDVVLLIGASDNLIMSPTERAAALLPLCQAALFTGGRDRMSFVLQVGRLLSAALPAVDAEAWKTGDAEDSAVNLRERVEAIAARRPDAWLTLLRCLGAAYRASWS